MFGFIVAIFIFGAVWFGIGIQDDECLSVDEVVYTSEYSTRKMYSDLSEILSSDISEWLRCGWYGLATTTVSDMRDAVHDAHLIFH